MPVVRRLFFGGLYLALAVIGLLAPLAIAPTHAQDSGSITIGVTDLPTTLDPGEAYDFLAWEVLSHLYTGLTRQITGTLDYELALAEDIQISDDRLTYTFTLRPDAAFSDGTPITAQTFVDSITRVRDLRRDASEVVEPYVSGVEAASDGRLVFRLTRPVPYFLALLALPPYFPQHPTLAASEQPVPFPDQIIGNGPYSLESFELHERIVLKANPAYQLGPQPATETIILRSFARSEALRDALRAHAIDMAWRALFLGHILELEGTGGLQVVDVPSTRVFYLYFNHDREPFDDPAAREAVTLLIEREPALADVFGSHITPLTSLVPAQFPDAYAPIWPDQTDQARAESVLHDAGYRTRGSSMLSFIIGYSLPTYGTTHAAALNEIVRQRLSISDYVEAGIFTDIQTSTLISAVERGEAAYAAFLGWTPLVPHPDAYLRPLAHSSWPIPANGRYAKPAVDQLLDEAAQLDDPAAQGPLYQAAAALLLEDYDLIPLWQDHLQAVAWDDITGIQIEPNFFLHYDLLARK